MKTTKVLLICCGVLAVTLSIACAKAELPKNAPTVTDVKVYRSAGIVKVVDPDGVKITIDHEDIPGYMGAMEMTEKVSDVKLLDGLKEGDKVDFELRRSGSELLIVSLRKTGEVAIVNGSLIFKQNCAECHGGFGEGAEKGIPLTSGHALHHSEKEFIERVTNGKKDEMPAFREKLSTEEIAAVVKFVRQDLQKAAGKNEEHSGHKH